MQLSDDQSLPSISLTFFRQADVSHHALQACPISFIHMAAAARNLHERHRASRPSAVPHPRTPGIQVEQASAPHVSDYPVLQLLFSDLCGGPWPLHMQAEAALRTGPQHHGMHNVVCQDSSLVPTREESDKWQSCSYNPSCRGSLDGKVESAEQLHNKKCTRIEPNL